MIGIIDYGAGNLASVRYAFQKLGVEVEVCSDPSLILRYSHLVLPGVGSFRIAMEQLKRENWPSAIRQHVMSKRPLLGICLGMQLLFDEGEENGHSVGLGLVPGWVKLMYPSGHLNLPHVGWNRLYQRYSHPIFDGIRDHVDYYFVHSYHCIPASEDDILSTCDYGGHFVASIARRNIVGMQFHPEKSQPTGLRILKQFAVWDGTC
jgi:glutamine amidotransferase